MAKKRKIKKSLPPIPVTELSNRERRELIKSGWRSFHIGDTEFLVQHRKANPPRNSMAGDVPVRTSLPRATWSVETDKTSKLFGKRIKLFSFSYKSNTVSDFDDIHDVPKSIKGIKDVFGYVVTGRGVQIFQKGKRKIIPGADDAYERISRDNRGWYGVRTESKDGDEARTLVTTSKSMARKWIEAGGRARVVKDISKSYAQTANSILSKGTYEQRKAR